MMHLKLMVAINGCRISSDNLVSSLDVGRLTVLSGEPVRLHEGGDSVLYITTGGLI
jgi:hypothetical protein